MTRVDEIERLGRLKEQGILTEEEFHREKSKILTGFTEPAKATGSDVLPRAWEERFAFFDENGNPFSRRATAAMREMGVWERTRIVFNIWGMLFGPFYFLYLGIPKRAAGLAGIGIMVGLLLIHNDLWSPESRWYGFVVAACFAVTANYFYYIKVRHGRDEWNPFTDLTN